MDLSIALRSQLRVRKVENDVSNNVWSCVMWITWLLVCSGACSVVYYTSRSGICVSTLSFAPMIGCLPSCPVMSSEVLDSQSCSFVRLGSVVLVHSCVCLSAYGGGMLKWYLSKNEHPPFVYFYTSTFPSNIRPASSQQCSTACPTMITWHSTVALDGGIVNSMEEESWCTLCLG